jgi:hypothetical protein
MSTLKKMHQSTTCKFSNLWHIQNQNVLSYDKSTIQSGQHPNSKQLDRLSSTKLWSFPNSIERFSNLWHLNNRNVFNCDKSIIKSSKHPNSKQVDKSSSTKLWSFPNSISRFSICGFRTIKVSQVVTSPQWNQINTPTWNK